MAQNLDAHDHWDNDRPLKSSLQKEAGDAFGKVVAGGVEIGRARVPHRDLDALSYDEPRLVHEFFVVAQIDESARDDVGRFMELASAAVDRCDNDAEPLLPERFSVAHQDVREFGHGVALNDS